MFVFRACKAFHFEGHQRILQPCLTLLGFRIATEIEIDKILSQFEETKDPFYSYTVRDVMAPM